MLGCKKGLDSMRKEYIRHQIHHPENKNNPRDTREELKQSIDLMRTFIEQQSAAGIVEP